MRCTQPDMLSIPLRSFSVSRLQGGIELLNGALIAADSGGSGNAGDLEINASEINISNYSRIGSATYTQGKGGNITLNVANSIIFRNNSEITSEAFNTADGGNITIEAGELISLVYTDWQGITSRTYARSTNSWRLGGSINQGF
ncbi:hypothetical protein WA1_24545 [Scytonema hofmannii PCC 7110]|uniref:Filamentous haemagglutinin FhaB/tRNA nuclease CdiA-like TPS domain-containing protein n=1 Tax=Scytonema hofmannii PCC 7110 TaxID=128403 RepID=A0A139X7W7_9CYAN|nr:hypothetical protein [Scytonema hofmannii]KYC40797.1 hypothetical protein WA1_24545 [Scytonema hofmannii PCC 7110]